MSDDARTREIVDRLRVQPESPRFFDELWARTQRRENAEVRRWRRIAIVAVAVALAAIAAAGVLAAAPSAASNVVDQTVTCANLLKGALPVFNVGASPTGQPILDEDGKVRKVPPGFHPPTSMYVYTGDVMQLLMLSTGASGYQLDRSRCVRTNAKPALGPGRLPKDVTLKVGDSLSFGKRCVDVARITIRVQIVSDSLGVPLRARLVVARAKSGTPLIYVEWARERVKSWAAARCDTAYLPVP